MSLATLADVLQAAKAGRYAVAGLVCLGWEDMRAYARAAETEDCPVILQAGPSCRSHTPLPVLGSMMRWLAESVSVPVVIHLDHGTSAKECREAIASGFTSVMFDGSKLPLQDNIERTRMICEMAHEQGISCEGEIGFVGYAGGAQSSGTDPEEAGRFAAETGVDAMAVSVGNVHLQVREGEGLDEIRIREIERVTDVPLVIHGGSGVPVSQRTDLSRSSNICKYNIGTELRRAFGAALRSRLVEHPDAFDRVEILQGIEAPLEERARAVIRAISKTGE